MTKPPAIAAIWLIGLSVFVWGAVQQGTVVNINRDASDQSAYLKYARQLSETDFAAVGDRARMPLYPAVLALFYREGMTDGDYFERGKLVSVVVALLVIGLIVSIMNWQGTTWDSTAAALVVLLTVLAFKAPYCQADVLYYGLSSLLFVLLLRLIDRPQLRWACVAGVVGGLAHLTKASALPAIALAITILISSGLIAWARIRKPEPQLAVRTLATHVGAAGLLLSCLLIVIYPYLQTSRDRFGHYFYNVNSTFYLWYDSWDEAKAGTRAHGDRVGWPDLPDEQIPSLSKYLREHSFQQIVQRAARGLLRYALLVSVYSYGYTEFMALYAILLALLFWQNRHQFPWRDLRHQQARTTLFVVFYFSGYLLLYAWFAPVSIGHRFILSLYVPGLLMAVRGLKFAREHQLEIRVWGLRLQAARISPLILIALAAYAVVLYPQRITTHFGGI